MVTYSVFLERDSETEFSVWHFSWGVPLIFKKKSSLTEKKKNYYISLQFIICINWFLYISITSAMQTTYKLPLTSSLLLVKIFQKLKIINQFGVYISLFAWNFSKYSQSILKGSFVYYNVSSFHLVIIRIVVIVINVSRQRECKGNID